MTAYIVDAVRTPRAAAKPDGAFAHKQPFELVVPLIEELANRHASVEHADDLLLGCSTQVGAQGANIARLSALLSDRLKSTPGATVGRFCCSGLDAIATGAGRILLGDDLILAGGVEQLSTVGMFDDKGLWFSNATVRERTGFVHMGLAADLLSSRYQISRNDIDEWAVVSHQRAAAAWQSGHYDQQVVPLEAVTQDQTIRNLQVAKIAALPALFADQPIPNYIDTTEIADSVQHIHTVATSPGIVDGASVVLLCSEGALQRYSLAPRAKILAHVSRTCDPTIMLEAHISAAHDALARIGKKPQEIARWEINESFGASVLHAVRSLAVDPSTVNIWGGALAMGHPLGATGGILIANLVDQLESGEFGVAMIPGGAGVGVATVIQKI